MSETKHQRANRITLEAARIALRDGQTRGERLRIYERELARLANDTPAGEVATTQCVEHISPAMKICSG